MTEKTPWEILSAIDVSGRIEKKNGLSYLSWAWAWAELKKHFPDAWFRKHEGHGGFPCFYDPQGYAFVKVSIGLDHTGSHEVTEMLPVLDHRNKPIQAPTSFDVNSAIQRCLTKAIAYHGLGHYIYAGEDMPEEAAQTPQQRPSANSGGQGSQNQQGDPSGPQRGATPQPVPTVKSPSGGSDVSDESVEILAKAFETFIPQCSTQAELSKFYAENRAARDYLAVKNKDEHDRIVAMFTAANKALQQPKQGE